MTSPLHIKAIEFGGPAPLFCIPLVAKNRQELLAEAQVAHRLEADIVEWRADFYGDVNANSLIEAARELRTVLQREPVLFTLRIESEGGATGLSQDLRTECITAVVRSGLVDLVDIELSNGPAILSTVIQTARRHDVRTIVSFHDFQATPANDELLAAISAMIDNGADIAKIACMPRESEDVLRLLQLTLAARRAFPALPLCIMSMGALGSITRVAGFLYGSDMAFAAGQEVSAPGQIPISEAREMAKALLHLTAK